MSFNEILEQLTKLTEDEKRQLLNILGHELADKGEESPEFLAELDARIRAMDHGSGNCSLDEARQTVRDMKAKLVASMLAGNWIYECSARFANPRSAIRSGLHQPC